MKVSSDDTKKKDGDFMRLSPKALRVNSKLSQENVANYLGISLSAYKRRENEEVKWYADELHLLSKLYKVNIGIFFENKVSFEDTECKEAV